MLRGEDTLREWVLSWSGCLWKWCFEEWTLREVGALASCCLWNGCTVEWVLRGTCTQGSGCSREGVCIWDSELWKVRTQDSGLSKEWAIFGRLSEWFFKRFGTHRIERSQVKCVHRGLGNLKGVGALRTLLFSRGHSLGSWALWGVHTQDSVRSGECTLKAVSA